MRIYLGCPSQISAVKACAAQTLSAVSMSLHRGAEQGVGRPVVSWGAGRGVVVARGMGKY